MAPDTFASEKQRAGIFYYKFRPLVLNQHNLWFTCENKTKADASCSRQAAGPGTLGDRLSHHRKKKHVLSRRRQECSLVPKTPQSTDKVPGIFLRITFQNLSNLSLENLRKLATRLVS